MKKLIAVIAALTLWTTPVFADEKTKEMNTDDISYHLGILIGHRIQSQLSDLDFEKFMEGIKLVYSGKVEVDKVKESNDIFKKYQQKEDEKKSQAAIKKGADFLAKNKKKKGVKTTTSGLQYLVMKKGTGKKPVETDKVTVHYKGTLLDGKEFDSSYKRGEPASFPLNGVIKGWTEGVQLMKEGAKFKFFIPPELAYGQRGAGGDIGPNETLIFEVELIKIGE